MGLTALLNDVQARVGDVVVLEFLSLLKGTYQDRVVLGRDEGDCVETEWWRHFKQVVCGAAPGKRTLDARGWRSAFVSLFAPPATPSHSRASLIQLHHLHLARRPPSQLPRVQRLSPNCSAPAHSSPRRQDCSVPPTSSYHVPSSLRTFYIHCLWFAPRRTSNVQPFLFRLPKPSKGIDWGYSTTAGRPECTAQSTWQLQIFLVNTS